MGANEPEMPPPDLPGELTSPETASEGLEPSGQSGSPGRRPNFAERAFPTLMRYMGLLLAMYEGLIDRPPQAIVVGLAAVMMAGAQVLESVVKRRGL